MRRTRSFWTAMTAATVLITPALGYAAAEDAALRPADARAARVLAIGTRESATFRRLVDRLDASDLLVYISVEAFTHDPYQSTLRFVAAAGDRRYVRIELQARNTDKALVEWLGHELQHAVEVADHVEIRSVEQLARYYGMHETGTAQNVFESTSAPAVQRRIASERSARR